MPQTFFAEFYKTICKCFNTSKHPYLPQGVPTNPCFCLHILFKSLLEMLIKKNISRTNDQFTLLLDQGIENPTYMYM